MTAELADYLKEGMFQSSGGWRIVSCFDLLEVGISSGGEAEFGEGIVYVRGWAH